MGFPAGPPSPPQKSQSPQSASTGGRGRDNLAEEAAKIISAAEAREAAASRDAQGAAPAQAAAGQGAGSQELTGRAEAQESDRVNRGREAEPVAAADSEGGGAPEESGLPSPARLRGGEGSARWWSATRIHGLRLLITVGLALLITALETAAPASPWRAWTCLALASVALSLGGEVIHNSIRGFSLSRINGDSLAALGALAALFGGTAATVLWSLGLLSHRAVPSAAGSGLTLGLEAALLLLTLPHAGRLLEAMMKRAAARQIQTLKDLRPSHARVLLGESEEEAPVEALEEGSRVLVLPGERMPVDGVLVEGQGAVDESILGTPEPVIKNPGSRVYAATLNVSQPLTIRAMSRGGDCAWHRALGIAFDSQSTPCPRSQGEHWASVGLCAAGVIASVFLGRSLWNAGFGYGATLSAALALLAAAWPGPVLVAGQAAVQTAIVSLAARGVLVRGLAVFGRLTRAGTAFFAKTGTLTHGHPQVAEVVPLKEGKAPEEILFLATVLEIRSEHPIAEGILGAGGGQRRTIPALRGFRALPGKGLRAQYKGREILFGSLPLLVEAGIDVAAAVKPHESMASRGLTPLSLAWGGELIGLVGMVDEERHGAREAISELKKLGIRCVVLTGDCRPTAEALAQNLGLDGARAGLSLEGKAELVSAERARGQAPLAVGHGVADASVLAAAEVGIALRAGEDLALDAAQGLVLGSDPRGVSRLLRCARETRAASRRALALALGLSSTVVAVFAFQAWAGRPLPAFAAALAACTATFAASVVARSLRGVGGRPAVPAHDESTPAL